MAHDGAPDGDALALAARELGGLRSSRARARGCGRPRPPVFGFRAWGAGDAQREAHFSSHCHVRVERVGLEYHGDAAVGRIDSLTLRRFRARRW